MAVRHSWPSGVVMRSPMPRVRTVASGASGLGVPRLKRPRAGYWPRAKTAACERAAPAPFDSKMPVKQMPLAWFRRWPSGGLSPGGVNASTSLLGVMRWGESHPAV